MPPVSQQDKTQRPSAYNPSGKYPSLLPTSYRKRDVQQAFRRNAIRLFARDYNFHKDAVEECVLANSLELFGGVKCKLDRMKLELQQEMFSSKDLQARVFEHAEALDQNNMNEQKLKDRSKEQRDAIWEIAFNDVVFWIIVDPLRQGIKTAKFCAIKEWRDIYRAMFVAAADAMYMCLHGPKPLKTINAQRVHKAVRSVVEEKFPDRPTFDMIPRQRMGPWDQSHRRTRIARKKSKGGADWARAEFVDTPKIEKSKRYYEQQKASIRRRLAPDEWETYFEVDDETVEYSSDELLL